MLAWNSACNHSIVLCTTDSGALAPAVINTQSFGEKPLAVQVLRTIDQIGFTSRLATKFPQSLRVTTILTSENEHNIGLRSQDSNGFLAILSGIANIFLGWTFNPRKSFLQSLNDAIGIIHAQGCLGQIGQLRSYSIFKAIDILAIFNQTIASGASPIVPMTSSCPSCPMSTIV